MSEQHDIPSSWQWSTMSASCEKIQDGTHFSPDQDKQLPEGKYPYVTAKNVRPSGLDMTNLTYLAEDEHRKIYERCDPKTGDVLLVKDGVNMGDAAINTVEGEISLLSSVCMLRPRKHVLAAEFLRYYIQSPQGFRSLTGQMTGTAIKRVILRKIRETPVPIAPLNEQSRIAAKIDELISDLDAGVAALKRARANLKRYRAAVLKAAVEGKLTEEWRATHPAKEPASALLARILKERRKKWEADQLAKFAAAEKEPPKNWRDKYVEPSPPVTTGLPELPANWCWANVEQLLAESTCNGISIKGSDSPPGIPALRLNSMTTNGFNYSERRYIPITNELASELAVQLGDMFVSRGNGSLHLVGRSVLAQEPPETIVFPDTMIRVRLMSLGELREFTNLTWASRLMRQQIEKKARTTAGIYKISQRDVEEFVIPLPPLVEQQQIVSEVAERQSQIDAAETEIVHSLLRASRLRQSILKQAFEGKLVPQDPKDEPASVLLERLRASRSVHEENGKKATQTTGRRRKSKRVEERAAE